MGPRILHRLNQFGDDMRGRRAVRIAHAKVDDILPGATGLCLGRVHFGEDVGRQTADAMKFAGGIGTHDKPFGVRWCSIAALIGRSTLLVVCWSMHRLRPMLQAARVDDITVANATMHHGRRLPR